MVTLKEAVSKSELKQFVKFPFTLYKDSPYWVPPIIADELETFDKTKNPAFKNAEASFYLAYKNNTVVGRVAAIINNLEINQQQLKKMRFGWFDFIDDTEVSEALLKKVAEIGQEHQLEYMEGPVGFSNLDKVGVLTEGFEHIGSMVTWYNHSYYQEHYERLGNDFLGLYKTLKNNPPIEVTLSRKQEEKFNTFFAALQTKYINLQPEEYIATVRRLGLIAFRFAMLFTALRIMEDGDVNKIKECEDADFDNAIAMIEVLVKHSSKVFNDLPIEPKAQKRMNKKERFLDALPNNFTRQDYLNTADKLGIPHKTAEGYITAFAKTGMVHRDSHGKYEKPK